MENNASNPAITTHTFQSTLLDSLFTFHVVRLSDRCLFVWVGDQGTFEHLGVAMSTPYNNAPLASNLLGYSADDLSCSLAAKLSKKLTGKQVFTSCNVSKHADDGTVLVGVTQRIVREIELHPEKF